MSTRKLPSRILEPSQTITSIETQGIKFPASQVPSADPNTLDDYEEGTFTPSILPTNGSITLATDAQTLSYVKIGSICNVVGYMRVQSVSSPSGTFDITLPFLCKNGTEHQTAALARINLTATGELSQFWAEVGPNSNNMRVFYVSGTGLASNSAQRLQTNTDIRIFATYPVQ